VRCVHTGRTMSSFLKPYLAALLVMGVLDALWLGVLAKDFYRQEMGAQMADQIRWAPALVFYFVFPAALVALALFPAGQPMAQMIARAALVGLVAYGVYDLTNMATLRHWPLKLALVDVAWGTFASTLAGGGAAWVMQRFG
jgi:uncharacterized membrane protein